MMMTVESNELAIRHCVDLFNRCTLEYVDACFAANAEWIELPNPGVSAGHRGDRNFLRETAARHLSLFPDRQMRIRNLVAQGSQVVVELDWWGASAVALGDRPAGTQVRFCLASFFTLIDGLIVRQTDYCLPNQQREE
jgi:ketosteroid isomerase-like protein